MKITLILSQDNPIDCLIKDGNAYVELTESLNSSRPNNYWPSSYPQGRYYQPPMMNYPQPYQMMMMPPYSSNKFAL